MGEAWGGAWLMWMLALGGSGFAVGSLVVFTMPASFTVRVVADAVVLAAVVLALGLQVIGLAGPLLGFTGAFLLPVLTAIGLRYVWSSSRKADRHERD